LGEAEARRPLERLLKGTHESLCRAEARANSAEKWAHEAERRADRERDATMRARSSARYWRQTALIAWAWLLVAAAEWLWHWPRWCVFPIVGAAMFLNIGPDYLRIRRIRRERKRELAKWDADRRAFIAEERQRKDRPDTPER
jgi:Flp pilus assembly protein TadB